MNTHKLVYKIVFKLLLDVVVDENQFNKISCKAFIFFFLVSNEILSKPTATFLYRIGQRAAMYVKYRTKRKTLLKFICKVPFYFQVHCLSTQHFYDFKHTNLASIIFSSDTQQVEIMTIYHNMFDCDNIIILKPGKQVN